MFGGLARDNSNNRSRGEPSPTVRRRVASSPAERYSAVLLTPSSTFLGTASGKLRCCCSEGLRLGFTSLNGPRRHHTKRSYRGWFRETVRCPDNFTVLGIIQKVAGTKGANIAAANAKLWTRVGTFATYRTYFSALVLGHGACAYLTTKLLKQHHDVLSFS